MVSLPTDEKSPISRYVSWDTDGDACNCFNKRLSVSSCILFEGGKRDGAFYVYRCRHYRHHHSSISFSALTHALRGKQEPAVADPTLARPEGADAEPATAATRPAKPPRVLLQMPVDVRSVSLVVLAWRWPGNIGHVQPACIDRAAADRPWPILLMATERFLLVSKICLTPLAPNVCLLERQVGVLFLMGP